MRIDIKTNIREIQADLKATQKQMARALADGINATAQRVLAAETQALGQVLDRPTQFTRSSFTMSRAFGGQYASPQQPTAIVATKPIQERYLLPIEEGSSQVPWRGKHAIRTPKGTRPDASGNIGRATVGQLLARSDTFVAKIGDTVGIFQRSTPPGRKHTGPRPKGGRVKLNKTGKIKLLVAFTEPRPVRKVLGFHDRAQRIAAQWIDRDFQAAAERVLTKVAAPR